MILMYVFCLSCIITKELKEFINTSFLVLEKTFFFRIIFRHETMQKSRYQYVTDTVTYFLDRRHVGHLFTISSHREQKFPLSRKRLLNHKKISADTLKHSRQKIRTSRIPVLNYEIVKNRMLKPCSSGRDSMIYCWRPKLHYRRRADLRVEFSFLMI